VVVFSVRLKRLIALLSRLPGVGEKTAQRYALHLLTVDESLSRELGAEIAALRDRVAPCSRCGNVADIRDDPDEAVCDVCEDGKRDSTVLCVVAKVQDVLAIERAGTMRGRYFVLGRLLSPLEGIGPDELPMDKLLAMIERQGAREIIIATPPSVDGEATALFLKQELGSKGVKLTRIASGVPHGGDLEFADPITMGRALAGRQEL
jgi:recombination protein RecR